MKKFLFKEDLEQFLRENRRDKKEKIDLKNTIFEELDLTGMDLSNIDFEWSDFKNVRLSHVNFENSNLSNVFLENADLSNSNFKNCTMHGTNLRYTNLENIDLSGADIFCANLEEAKMDGIKTDENTKHYKMICPETGAFLGWKTCFNKRLVRLLIPADARRTSSTMNTCRCDKAKVISISDSDEKEKFDEAVSYVDGDFVYKVGEMVYAKGFNPDRWRDSTGGIHFFMTKEEALGYLMSIS
ncbi:pentapeptide repeat-containing protein [Peptacetobacter sp.]|uniref:pentapeptide repeat-containing protein n=1 Tax=Peptacetobacter sp. TaxID=2991975 RepID=UPI0026299391|nr:pentapeptide repeat-containing protein [Peptacetobacter sp.]